MEAFYECSGWCTKYPIQYFNNVNSKLNTKYIYNKISVSCAFAILNFWGDFYFYLSSSGFALGVFFMMMFFFTCLFCLHPGTS